MIKSMMIVAAILVTGAASGMAVRATSDTNAVGCACGQCEVGCDCCGGGVCVCESCGCTACDC